MFHQDASNPNVTILNCNIQKALPTGVDGDHQIIIGAVIQMGAVPVGIAQTDIPTSPSDLMSRFRTSIV